MFLTCNFFVGPNAIPVLFNVIVAYLVRSATYKNRTYCAIARKGFWDGLERFFFFLYLELSGLDFISLTPLLTPTPLSGQNRGNIIHFARFYSVGVRNR